MAKRIKRTASIETIVSGHPSLTRLDARDLETMVYTQSDGIEIPYLKLLSWVCDKRVVTTDSSPSIFHQLRDRILLPPEDWMPKQFPSTHPYNKALEKMKKDREVKKRIVAQGKEKCPECGSRNVIQDSSHTRSADEASTVFLTCGDCDHPWKIDN